MVKKTKGERREEKRRNRRKMVVTGKGNQLLWRLILEKAEKARQRKK